MVMMLASGCSDVSPGQPCDVGQGRCEGSVYQVCEGDRFVDNETCGGDLRCFPSIGCGECDPEVGSACVGTAVHQCLADGRIGDRFRECGAAGCSGGTCRSDCSVSGVQLIYLIDDAAVLRSFDPGLIGEPGGPFVEIGTLECAAGAPLEGFDGPEEAIPFSMAVDRSGRAWVLYSSGQIMWVSTTDGLCQVSPYSPGSGGFELFGMGFVSDGEDTNAETLYIAGGAAGQGEVGDLGRIDGSHRPIRIGELSATTIEPRATPELTGTGEGRLYGYYPGNESAVIEISRSTGAELSGQELEPADGDLAGWAFAHWNGLFYIFLTTNVGIDPVRQVIEVNPALGTEEVVMDGLPFRVVGAGVSTCAPTGTE